MTRDEAHQVFERLRGRFAAKHPAMAKVRLRLARKHFLKHPAARDLAWYEPSERTVYLMERALAGHAGRVSGLLAHELGHAADSDTSRPYAELRADALAKAAIGRPIRYDAGDVQNLEVGVTPRPPYLHENKPMKRNPAKGYKMPEAQARHTAEGLLARMKADGADTFAKKVKWVKKHIPSIDRPRTFVGWVTKGERGRVVYQRNPKASVKQQILALDRRIKAMEEAGYAPHSLIEKRDLLVAKVRRRKP